MSLVVVAQGLAELHNGGSILSLYFLVGSPFMTTFGARFPGSEIPYQGYLLEYVQVRAVFRNSALPAQSSNIDVDVFTAVSVECR